jgi:high-affinity iron transporter
MAESSDIRDRAAGEMMFSGDCFWLSLIRRVFLVLAFLASPAFAQENPAQAIVHLLDYVGVDYSGAVADGKVTSEDEFKEMVEFTTEALKLLRALPQNPQRAAIVADAEQLARMVRNKAAAPDVAAVAGKVRWALIAAYGVEVAPKSAPDLAKGAMLYQTMCAACHGAQGKGDGPAATKLDPPPSNFHDADRMSQRSAYGLYNTISLGVAGTGMTAFRQLSEEDRWALAFHTAGFPQEQARKQGEALWRAGKGKDAFRDLRSVTTLSANDVRDKFGADAVLVQAYLLGNPRALEQGKPGPIEFTQATLREAVAAYRKGDRAAAQKLAIAAYIEGFELAEASLRNVDSQLVQETEQEMMALRALIQRGAPTSHVEQQLEKTAALLARAQERLSGGALSAGATFVSSLLILLREGLEAILVLAAIFAFLIKAGRRDALPYAHAGWGAAVALGAVTWIVATFVVGLSGADRELTEGVTALIAAAMLIYVGFWLHSKAYAHAWERFIREQVDAALGKKTLWAIAAVSFLAVYRELFEIVLFYEALWAQAGGAGRGPLLAGIVAAAVLLAVIGWAIFRYSVRLPIGPFFAAMSVLLALLAVVFAGNGVAALQEAGVVAVDPIAFVSAPMLGVHPTLETVAAQAITLAVVLASFYLASRGERDRRTASAAKPT